MIVGLRCAREDKPGPVWQEIFERTWPHYQAWYLSEGHTGRPTYLECRDALKTYMPELASTYSTLCELAGGGDLAARYLSLFDPPPFMSGCTQLVWPGDPPAIVRNYDYHPRWFEGTLLYTDWLRPVMAVSDCNWGVLDGMNAQGLCASLAFGGRKVTGPGFGISLILRYVLETCSTVKEATQVLDRVPSHMVYNVVLLDAAGRHATVYLGPDRSPGIVESRVTSNHQETIDWPEYAVATATVEREASARDLLANPERSLSSVIKHFLRPPLYSANFERSFGTLYTAAWIPTRGELRLAWPHSKLVQSFDAFHERQVMVSLRPRAKARLTR